MKRVEVEDAPRDPDDKHPDYRLSYEACDYDDARLLVGAGRLLLPGNRKRRLAAQKSANTGARCCGERDQRKYMAAPGIMGNGNP